MGDEAAVDEQLVGAVLGARGRGDERVGGRGRVQRGVVPARAQVRGVFAAPAEAGGAEGRGGRVRGAELAEEVVDEGLAYGLPAVEHEGDEVVGAVEGGAAGGS